MNEKLEYLYRIFPGFCLGNGLLNLTINKSKKQFGDGVIIKGENSFAWDVVMSNVTYLLVEAVIYFFLAIFIDRYLNDPNFLQNVAVVTSSSSSSSSLFLL